MLTATAASAETIHVPAEQATIQAGLDAASPGHTVLVAPGTYLEHNISFGGKDLILKSASGPTVTIIDGENQAPVVRLGSGLTRSAVVEGFTIQNGKGNGPDGGQAFFGGGITIASGSPTIRGNIITSNAADLGGGGVKARVGANPLIQDNQILNNSAAEKGGGIQIINSAAEIIENTISSNSACATSGLGSPCSGGGVNLNNGTGTILVRENLVSGNSAGFTGGGMSILRCDFELDGNQILDNDSEFGGGVHVETNGGLQTWLITDNNFANNTATQSGAGLNFGTVAGVAPVVDVVGNVFENNECIDLACSTGFETECCLGGGFVSGRGLGDRRITDNTIRANRADVNGAALLISGDGEPQNVIFSRNVVHANTSRFNHPGVSCGKLNECTLSENQFVGNVPETPPLSPVPSPGAVAVQNCSSASIENNFFFANEGRVAGAIVLRSTGNVEVRNNTFVDNVTLVPMGGTVWTEVSTTIRNNLFSGDSRGVFAKNTPSLQVQFNNFDRFSVGVFKGASEHFSAASLNTESFASDNLEVDPELIELADYHLSDGSPLEGAAPCGTAPSIDLSGEPRPLGTGCEIGADEFNPEFAIFTDGFESGDVSRWSSSVE